MIVLYQYVAPAMVLVFGVALPGWLVLVLADAALRWPLGPDHWREWKRDAKVAAAFLLALVALVLCFVEAGR